MLKSSKYIFIILGVALGLFLTFVQIKGEGDIAKIVFFDIGQGDAILIVTPDNTRILIDGGPGNYLINELGSHLSFYDRHIDIMILTHAHDDHVSGLNEVLNRYKVDLVLFPGFIDYNAESYIEWLRIIEEKGVPLQSTTVGDVYTFTNSSLEILYPFEAYTGQKIKDVNDTSVVAKYCYIDICTLLTGDATTEVEEEILHLGLDIQSDILKSAHHGSQYSNSENWLFGVNPSTVIIQSGLDNRFNHPHLRIIKRLGRMGIRILRNDELGEIILKTNGYNYWVE